MCRDIPEQERGITGWNAGPDRIAILAASGGLRQWFNSGERDAVMAGLGFAFRLPAGCVPRAGEC